MPTLCPSTERPEPSLGPPCGDAVPIRTTRSLCHFLSLREGAQRRAQRPISINPGPNVSALHSDTEPRPPPLQLSPAPRRPGFLPLGSRALPAQPVHGFSLSVLVAKWTKPNRRMIPGAEPSKEEAGRKDSESIHVKSDTQVQHSGRNFQVMGKSLKFQELP